MASKNPWSQSSNMTVSSLQQFSEEIGITTADLPRDGEMSGHREEGAGDFAYAFMDTMRAADKGATLRRNKMQKENYEALLSSPAYQFATSSAVSRVLSLTESLKLNYQKYSNPSFLKHLEKEVRRKDANSFVYMASENRAYFYEILSLALKLADEQYVAEVLVAQNSADANMQTSIESAKSLLHDLCTLEDLVENMSNMQNEFVKHINA